MKKFAIIILLLWACNAYAHGTGYKFSELRAVSLEFFYSTGEKMSYREAKVFSPNDNKFAAQTGRTDEHGRFAFVPDSAGEWRVIVRDEEGHQCEAKINITPELENFINTSQNENNNNYDLLLRALLGVSIIFNIAMIIRWGSSHAHQ